MERSIIEHHDHQFVLATALLKVFDKGFDLFSGAISVEFSVVELGFLSMYDPSTDEIDTTLRRPAAAHFEGFALQSPGVTQGQHQTQAGLVEISQD
jgi:hypothetical protein